MLSILLYTPNEMKLKIAGAARACRLKLNMSQKTLSARSGVSYGVVKRFEQSGDISLVSLLRLSLVLGAMDGFGKLFEVEEDLSKMTTEKLLKQIPRKRGRK